MVKMNEAGTCCHSCYQRSCQSQAFLHLSNMNCKQRVNEKEASGNKIISATKWTQNKNIRLPFYNPKVLRDIRIKKTQTLWASWWKNPTPPRVLPKGSNLSLIQPLDVAANLQKIKGQRNATASWVYNWPNPENGKLYRLNGLDSSTDNLWEKQRGGVGGRDCTLKDI